MCEQGRRARGTDHRLGGILERVKIQGVSIRVEVILGGGAGWEHSLQSLSLCTHRALLTVQALWEAFHTSCCEAPGSECLSEFSMITQLVKDMSGFELRSIQGPGS